MDVGAACIGVSCRGAEGEHDIISRARRLRNPKGLDNIPASTIDCDEQLPEATL